MVIYYFRQPDNKVEVYEVYGNKTLSVLGESYICTVDSYSNAILVTNSLNKYVK